MNKDQTPKIKVSFEGDKVDAMEVDFEMIAEPWVEVKCSDGTTIMIRPTINKILRLEKFDPVTGEPTYLVQSHNQLLTKNVQPLVRK